MLADIGLVTIPPEVQIKSRTSAASLSAEERKLLEQIPQISSSLVANIPRLEKVSEAILYQAKNIDGSGFPADAIKGEQIPVAARFIKIVRALAEQEIAGASRAEALAKLLAAKKEFDQGLLTRIIKGAATSQSAATAEVQRYEIKVKDLCIGQILRANITDKEGRLLIAEGATVSGVMITQLQNYASLVGVVEPIFVHARIPGV